MPSQSCSDSKTELTIGHSTKTPKNRLAGRSRISGVSAIWRRCHHVVSGTQAARGAMSDLRPPTRSTGPAPSPGTCRGLGLVDALPGALDVLEHLVQALGLD